MKNVWKFRNSSIELLTLEEFKALPSGTKLIDIFGEERAKDDKTDDDTRGGYVAYGLASSLKLTK